MSADPFIFALSLLAALGWGRIAGAFFAFSTFVMRALARLPAHEGIAAMQAINLVVINPTSSVRSGRTTWPLDGVEPRPHPRGGGGDGVVRNGAAALRVKIG
ncbi:MAG: hypothetical protein WBD40_21305 [Tepidisphaeraceae bacterium]